MQARLISRDSHPVSRKDISPSALKVLYRLKEAGFEAYLVGGGVRDLLLGKKPKDFDVATNAKPEEIRKVFRNCRLVGRRFRLAHVQFGREIIEVSTFRANHGDSHPQLANQDDSGMLLRDNVYGNVEEDALRRDFTINALYYSIDGFAITDFTGGYQDLEQRLLRLIGDPERRYREDPVRMLRTVRFLAKLDFQAEPATLEPVARLAPLLAQIPSARLIDEVFKLLHTGYGLASYRLLREHQIWPVLFPLESSLPSAQQTQQHQLLEALFELADSEQAKQSPISQALLLASLLWYPLNLQWQQLIDQGIAPVPAFQQAMSQVIEQQNPRVAIVKRIAFDIRDIWLLQLRLEQRPLNRLSQIASHEWFAASLDLFWLRSQIGELPDERYHWWLDYFEADQSGRDALFVALRAESQPARPGKPKRKPRPKPAAGETA